MIMQGYIMYGILIKGHSSTLVVEFTETTT